MFTLFLAVLQQFASFNAELPGEIMTFIQEDNRSVTDLYKHLHANPELSLQEENTAHTLATELRQLDFEVHESFGGHGVVGILRNGPGPRILYRTDMDALPIKEETGLTYASTSEVDYGNGRTGVMHACGHDVHMSTWVGVARTMAKFRDHWSGTLVLIGQPAEEVGQGADMMLANGLYEKFGVPDYGIALHTTPNLPAGEISVSAGFTMARAESVDITVYGKGAHGALPHESIDPIVVASMMVVELQTIVSRSVKPTDAAVITVGSIQGGVKNNIIPDKVILKLTIRTFTEEVRELVHRRIREVTRGVAVAAGLPEDKMPRIDVLDMSAPPNYNDPDLVGVIRAAATKVIGGLDYNYAIKGDGELIVKPVDGKTQRETLKALLKTLSAETLAIPEDKLGLFPPRAFGYGSTRESFNGNMGVAFDPFGAVETSCDMTLGLLLNAERMNRVYQQNVLDQSQLDIKELIETLASATIKKKTDSDYLGEVQQTINISVLKHIMAISSDEKLMPQVQALVNFEVMKLKVVLQERRVDPVAMLMVKEIDKFLGNPSGYKAPEAPKIPDGSPIGTDACSYISN